MKERKDNVMTVEKDTLYEEMLLGRGLMNVGNPTRKKRNNRTRVRK